MKIIEEQRRKTDINLTALIDVLFLLIIFFSVSTQFTNQQAVEVNLPKTQSSQSVNTKSRLIILMQSKAAMLLNGVAVKADALEQELKSSAFDKEKKVILNIDQAVTHGDVVWLLDLLKKGGFKQVAFGTEIRTP